MATVIYILRDPRDRSIRYVGKTAQELRRRLSQHIASANKGRRWKSAVWIRGLIAAGVAPEAEVVEMVAGNGWEDAERRWIAKLAAQGHALTNSSEGGDGPNGYRHSDEARAKIAAARMGVKASPETIRKLRARINPSDFGARVSAAKKGRVVVSDAQRAAIADSLRRHYTDPENRAKMSAAKKANPPTFTASQRAERSAFMRALWAERRATRA